MESHKGGGDDSDRHFGDSLCPRPENTALLDSTGNCNALRNSNTARFTNIKRISTMVESVAPGALLDQLPPLIIQFSAE